MNRERKEDISKKILETSRETQRLKQELEALIASGIRGKSSVTLHSDQHLPTVPSTSLLTYRDVQALTAGASHTQIIKSYDLKHSDRMNKVSHRAKSTENLNTQDQCESTGTKRKPYDQHEAREFIKKQKAKRKEELKKKTSHQLEAELRKEKLQKLKETARELVKRNVEGRTGARIRTKSAEPQLQKFRQPSRSPSRERKKYDPNNSIQAYNCVRAPTINSKLLRPPKQVYGHRQELLTGLSNLNSPTKQGNKAKDIPKENEEDIQTEVPPPLKTTTCDLQIKRDKPNLDLEIPAAMICNPGMASIIEKPDVPQNRDAITKPIPEWLREKPPTDPCNFINTVKRRLLNERKSYHVDVGVQGNLEPPNVALISEKDQPSGSHKTDLKSFISHKCLNLHPRSLQVDHQFISIKDGATNTEESSSGNEYDTSRNIPSISTESATSIRRSETAAVCFGKNICEGTGKDDVPLCLDARKVQDIGLRNPDNTNSKKSTGRSKKSHSMPTGLNIVLSDVKSKPDSKMVDNSVPTYTQIFSNLSSRNSKVSAEVASDLKSTARSFEKTNSLLTISSESKLNDIRSKQSKVLITDRTSKFKSSLDSTISSDLKRSRESIISFNCAKVSPNKVPVFLPEAVEENINFEKSKKKDVDKSSLTRNITTRRSSNNSTPENLPTLSNNHVTKNLECVSSDQDFPGPVSTLRPSSDYSDGSEEGRSMKLISASIQTESLKTLSNPSILSEKTTAKSKSRDSFDSLKAKPPTEEIVRSEKSKSKNKMENYQMTLLVQPKGKENDDQNTSHKQALLKNITLRSGDDRNSLKHPQEIHLKFEAEIHLISEFKDSIRRLSQIEETFESLRHDRGVKSHVEENSKYEKGTQTSVLSTPCTDSKTPELEKSNTIQDMTNSQIISDVTDSQLLNLSQLSFHTDFNSENCSSNLDNSLPIKSISENTGPLLSVSQVNSDHSLRERGGFFTSIGDENVVLKNIAGVSLRMYDQLLNDEDARIENWKMLLKIREQFLLDRTKRELMWLEMQRKQLIDTGKLSEASLIKKKQRGILLKHQQEKLEMQKLKQMQKKDSQKRKSILNREKDLIKSQLMSVNMLSGLRPCTPKERRERRLSGPLKVIQQTSGTMRSETSISKGTAGTDEEIKSITTRTSKTHSIVSIVSEHSQSTVSDVELPEVPEIGSDKEIIDSKTIYNLKKTFLMKEQALAKRKKTVEELIQWHKKLQDEEKAIADLETKIVTITSKIPSEFRHRPPRRSKSLSTLSFISNEPEDVHSMPQLTDQTLQPASIDSSKKSGKESEIVTNILTEDNTPELEESARVVSSANYTGDFDAETVATVSEEQNSVSSISQLIEDFSKIKDNILNITSVSSTKSGAVKSETVSVETVNQGKDNEERSVPVLDETVVEEVQISIGVEIEEHIIDAVSHVDVDTEHTSDDLVLSTYVVDEPGSIVSDNIEKIPSAVEIQEISSVEDSESEHISSNEASSVSRLAVPQDEPIVIAEEGIESNTSSAIYVQSSPSVVESNIEQDILHSPDVHLSVSSSGIPEQPDELSRQQESTEIHSLDQIESIEDEGEESLEQNDDSTSTVLSIQNRISEIPTLAVNINDQLPTSLDQDESIQSMENKTDEEKAASMGRGAVTRSIASVPTASIDSSSSVSSEVPSIESHRSASTSSRTPATDTVSPRRELSPKPCSSVNVERRVQSPGLAAVEASVDQVVPETSQPVDDHKRPFLLGSEAEELHKKQLAIEQEIKFLEEQQQKKAAAPFYIREIPNKPPPPYTPPSKTKLPKAPTIIPSSKEEVEEITEYSAKILYKAYRSRNLEKINISENTLNLIAKNIDKSCYKYVFDLCKELAQEYYSLFNQSGPSWLQIDAKPTLTPANIPDVEALKKFLNSKLLILFEFEKDATKRENAITKWSKKKRDHVDEPLLQQLLAEESTWTHFDYDGAQLKDRLTNEIMDMLLKDCAQAVKQALAKKFQC